MEKRNTTNQYTYYWPEDVLVAVEKGEITLSEAFVLFRQLDNISGYREKDNGASKGLEEALTELEQLIGLTSVKKLIYEIQAFVEIQKRRQQEKLVTDPLVLHMVFKGNPGTGKTTVARIIGKIFRAMGVLQKGHIVEVERADLVGEYIGHTAQKTRDQLKKAMGGILFIDEAYSLARGGEKDFGKESIDCCVKFMEDNKDDLVLILAGYRYEMESFLNVNPGLHSRFPIHIDFPDYSLQELLEIARTILNKRQYRLSPMAEKELTKLIAAPSLGSADNLGNARMIRNVIEKSIRRQAVRLVRKSMFSREDLMTIQPEDLREVE
jgi:stage V sporulation protein K